MCRFLVYKGFNGILLSKLILEPTHSILTQSYDCRLRLDTRRPHNGDGFGVGFYTEPDLGPEPCIFTSTIPAWNCINLERLASKITSSLVFAHVRASTEGNLSDQNCHPFRHGSLMWMHNGGIGGFRVMKRKLAASVSDKWFMEVKGSTDSEWAFALFLDKLEKLGCDPSAPPSDNGFGAGILRKAMLQTIDAINGFTAEIREIVGEKEAVSLLNFAVTDGHAVVCSRYVSSKTDEAASLFFSSGTSWKAPTAQVDKGQYQMERRDKGADIVLVASEPLTFERDNWVAVPTNSLLTISDENVAVHPVFDEFYNDSPSYIRSSQLAEAKGQMILTKTDAPPAVNGVNGVNGAHELDGTVTPDPLPNPHPALVAEGLSIRLQQELERSAPLDLLTFY